MKNQMKAIDSHVVRVALDSGHHGAAPAFPSCAKNGHPAASLPLRDKHRARNRASASLREVVPRAAESARACFVPHGFASPYPDRSGGGQNVVSFNEAPVKPFT
jgi:hypothetical protein